AAPAVLDRDALGRRVARDSRAGRRARATARAARGRLLPPRAPAVGRAPGAARASPPRLSGTRLPPPARARPGAPCPPARPARALHPGGRSRGDAAQARPSPRPPPLGADPGRVRDRARRRAAAAHGASQRLHASGPRLATSHANQSSSLIRWRRIRSRTRTTRASEATIATSWIGRDIGVLPPR